MAMNRFTRLSLAILLVSMTTLLTSCHKEDALKEKDPRVALVGTRWRSTLDISRIGEILSGIDLEELKGVSAELFFTTDTEGLVSIPRSNKTITAKLTYSYDPVNNGYLLTFKIGQTPETFPARVDWRYNRLTLHAGSGYNLPVLFFELVK